MTFTVADAGATAERLTAEHQAIAESVNELEDQLGRILPEDTALEGVTRERRSEVQEGFAVLWTRYGTYRAGVERVRAIMAPRSRPTRAELHEVEELVTGAAAVTSPGSDGSLPPKQATLDELVAKIQVTHAGIRGVLTAVDQVRVELGSRIDRCEELLREAEALSTELGNTADAAAVPAQLTSQLDAVRRIGRTDPLRLWSDDAVDLTEVDQLTARCERAYADLFALGELRRHAALRLDRVSTTLTEVTRLDERAADERNQAHAKIRGWPAPGSAVPTPDPVGPRLAAARELSTRGHWRRLATELPTLERDADAALERAEAALTEAAQPLRARAELRGRLGAYRAKAAGQGRIEELALVQRYQRAHDLLWSAPCDLAAAAEAVADYQSAVNANGGAT
ncbi:MAG: hypothetical protein ACRDUV_25045 [Pseudonocardiaceae bacterium]